jgi:Ni,Fe-hydrogenase III large subunit
MLELERLHSHLLWVGLACHIVGFDTLFMQSFRIREPVMWIAEKISGNRKTYALCVIGGVRWDITPELKAELRQVLDTLETEWTAVTRAIEGPQPPETHERRRHRRLREWSGNGLARTRGPRRRGGNIDSRRDHPYAAYDRVEFDVITASDGDVWSRVVVRALEVFQSIRIIRQCLDKLEPGPLQAESTMNSPSAGSAFPRSKRLAAKAIISSSPARTTGPDAGGSARPPIRTSRASPP